MKTLLTPEQEEIAQNCAKKLNEVADAMEGWGLEITMNTAGDISIIAPFEKENGDPLVVEAAATRIRQRMVNSNMVVAIEPLSGDTPRMLDEVYYYRYS